MRRELVEQFIRQIDPEKAFNEAKRDFKEYYGTHVPDLQAAEKAFRNLIVLLLRNEEFPEPKVSSRIKDREGSITKFELKYRQEAEQSSIPYKIQDYITDLIGLRIVCLPI